MLDKFVYGQVERVSPEAPVPVLHFQKETHMLGGAANVARNVVALGGKAILAGVVGDDDAGRFIAHDLCAREGVEGRLLLAPGITTTVKSRFVSGGQQIMRLDLEQRLHVDDALLDRIGETFLAVADRIHAVVLSDYAKGTLSVAVVRRMIALARERGLPVVVDPKASDVDRYAGATILTPNALEAATITGVKCDSDAAAEQAARTIVARSGVEAVIVTRGPDGMTVFAPSEGPPAAGMPSDTNDMLHIATMASEVFDVSGAGDTVVATLALAVASDCTVAQAAEFANAAAGISVGKLGTSVVLPHELRRSLLLRSDASDQKIVDADDAALIIAEWRGAGLTVGFTNGCYDLLHPGHVQLLKKARAACDRLVVALNTDASVRRLKGPTRPVQNEVARATVMAAIHPVDLVTLFDADTPLSLIEMLKPDILVKGDDYTIETVVGADVVMAYGGRVVLVPLEKGHSTTSMIARANVGVA